MAGERESGRRAGTAVARLPTGPAAAVLARWLPSGRSLLAAFAILLAALGLYVAARQTSMFAVRSIAVSGAPPRVAEHVRAALAPLRGKSLLAVSADELDRRMNSVPEVASATYDRAFPHTIRIAVRPERAVAVVRRGADAWLVSARARVLRTVAPQARPGLARVWLPAESSAEVGSTLTDPDAAQAVQAIGFVGPAHVPIAVRFARVLDGQVVLFCRSGLEIRLGNARAVELKLAIARRVLRSLVGAAGPGAYIDVSVPERPVAQISPQVGG